MRKTQRSTECTKHDSPSDEAMCPECYKMVRYKTEYQDASIVMEGLKLTYREHRAYCPFCGAEVRCAEVEDYNAEAVREAYYESKKKRGKKTTDNKALKKAIKSACKNPYWEDVYRNAPTENTKRYYALTFLSSECTRNNKRDDMRQECVQEIKSLYGKFTAEEWEYIRANCGTGQMRALCEKKIKALKNKQK